MICCRRLLLLILLSSTVALRAQQLITNYSVDAGLPQSTVMALYRDNDGYLWCGTGSGLGFYDGWEFHSPITDPEKANPNLNAPVRGIVPSTDQKTVWVGTESVVMQFDRYNFKVIRSFDIVKRPGVAEVPVFANDTAAWLVCWGSGLYRVRISDGKVTQLTNDSFVDDFGYASEQHTVVFPDTTNHFIFYDILTNTVRRIPRPEMLRGETTGACRMLPGSATEMLMCTHLGLWKVNIASGEMTPYDFGDPSYNTSSWKLRGIDIHPDGSWWIAVVDHGVFRYDPVQRKLRPCRWQQDGTDVSNLLRTPKSLVCDAYGVVWLATDGAGLVKLLNNRVTFSQKFTSSFVTDTCNWFIRSFFEMSSGRYLIGTYRGGVRLADENRGAISNPVSGTDLLYQQTPLFITGSGEGRLVIGTESGVVLLDTNTWTTQKVKPFFSIADQKFLGSIHLQNGKMLIYGNNGMHELEFGPVPHLGPVVGEIANVSAGIQLSNGRILVATYYNGIQEITQDGKFVKYYDYESYMGIANTTIVHGMVETSDGNIWIGTQAGILCLDANCKVVKTVTTENGLPDNTVYDVITLNYHTLAIATGHGVAIYDVDSGTITCYRGEDGLPSEECNTGALLYSESGMLYIGTTEGFVVWNPDSKVNCFRASHVLTSYASNGLDASGIITESIIRDYGAGSIDLKLWLTDFAFPDRAVFKYRLEGIESEEKTETGLRKITYAALGSGFYSFLCSVDVPGCGLTSKNKLFTIKIIPPFWMSGWFIAISSLGIIVIITLALFIIMRMNYQRKLRKLRMQQALDKVRARISRDIHDDIGAGLTRIALSGELMAGRAAGDAQQQEKLKWIAGTARELSQSMKEVVWSVNPHYDSLDHMSAYFRSYVSGVAENADVRFVYVAPDNIPAEEVNPEVRRNLLLILKESVSNAVKYSGCTELKLEISWRDDVLTMKISDNGNGFDIDNAAGVNSNGLRNIRQRAESSGGTVKIHSEKGKGTTIEIVCRVLTGE